MRQTLALSVLLVALAGCAPECDTTVNDLGTPTATAWGRGDGPGNPCELPPLFYPEPGTVPVPTLGDECDVEVEYGCAEVVFDVVCPTYTASGLTTLDGQNDATITATVDDPSCDGQTVTFTIRGQ